MLAFLAALDSGIHINEKDETDGNEDGSHPPMQTRDANHPAADKPGPPLVHPRSLRKNIPSLHEQTVYKYLTHRLYRC